MGVIGILAVLAFLHALVLDFPSSTILVFDEQFYVPAARLIVSHTLTGITYLNDYGNLEHPPLVKLIIAAGIYIFGDNPTGWRIFIVLFGLGLTPVVYRLGCQLATGSPLFATVLFSFDSLIFAQSSLAVLDIPMLFFILFGFLLYFRKSYWLVGISFGLAILCKETAILGIAGLLIYHLLYGQEKAKGLGFMLLPAFVISIIGLQLYDSFFTVYPTFLSQLGYIITYSSELKGHSWCTWAQTCADGPYINPLNWITVYYPPGYYLLKVTSNLAIGWRGISTLPVVWIGLIAMFLKRNTKEMRFPIILFLTTYLPYIPIYLTGRNTYPFYFIPSIFPLCIAAASLRPKWKAIDFTKLYQVALGLTVILWFAATYPLD